jgi:hypothetical protein
MAVHLVIRRPLPAPAAQLRIVWQGHREGDLVEARWTDGAGGAHCWPTADTVRWLLRDDVRQGEEWKVNLNGIPGDVDRVVLSMASTVARTVGLAVLPLNGDAADAALHPGAELTAGRTQELLALSRSGQGWAVTAVNTPADEPGVAPGGDPVRAEPTSAHPRPAPAQVIPGWSGPVTDRPFRSASPAAGSGDEPVTSQVREPPAPIRQPIRSAAEAHGPQVQIPTRLQPAVDAARGAGNAKRQSLVGAVVDLSASMRPWIVSGQLAAVLTAVQAVAGVSNRPSVATSFLPAGQDAELELGSDPAELVHTQLTANGLRTGDRSALLASIGRATRRGGVHILVTDDASAAADVRPAVIVLLGAGGVAGDRDPSSNVVAVPPGPVNVPRLARELADATGGA